MVEHRGFVTPALRRALLRICCYAEAQSISNVERRLRRFRMPNLRQQKQKTADWRFLFLVEHRGFEPLTPTLPVLCAPNCANAPK